MSTTPADSLVKPEQEYLAFLSQGRFMVQRSRSSGRHVFYPRISEPLTGARDLEWIEASGLGTVYATSVMRQRTPSESYNVALIDLAEGVRMMSRVEGLAPDAVAIGMAVKARITQIQDQAVVVFDPLPIGDAAPALGTTSGANVLWEPRK